MNAFNIDLANERRRTLLTEAAEARRAASARSTGPRWVRRWRHPLGTVGTDR